MKTLRLLLVAVALMAAPASFAQLKGFGFGPYAELAFPTGDFGKFQSTGYGGGLAIDIKLPLKLGITASAGVLHFPTKEAGASVTGFPVRAGIRYRFSVLYAGVEAGSAPLTKNMGSPLLLAPAIGVRVSVLDVKAKYETWFQKEEKGGNLGFFGLVAALKF
ncbi:MAG: hypothetical protein EOO11_03990 [Chitinophagaceae bacterium]|nr:MAG: hypothetical protein EOO11_03990 [Chitinophagaceae bacterium]